MNSGHYLGMQPGDLDDKPYAKYWKPTMGPLQSHVNEALLHGEEAGALGFTLCEAKQLLLPGHLALENGFTTLPDGKIFVAVRTDMPRVTGAMFEWWMGWHYMEHQRYKLWHPRAHIANGTHQMQGDNPQLSDREKYLTTHYITEYVGNRREDLTIAFSEPAILFAGKSRWADNGITAMFYGRVGLQRAPITIGHLLHQIRATPGGSEMRSRFWLGKPQFNALNPRNPINRILGSNAVSAHFAGAHLGRDMLVHCGMEMHHLAQFLPELYQDYHHAGERL
ncbi:MAG: hypothetical protein P8J79_07465 [Halioglobus sp.]|nr:hypothetical protein [Halioglobus sp.]